VLARETHEVSVLTTAVLSLARFLARAGELEEAVTVLREAREFAASKASWTHAWRIDRRSRKLALHRARHRPARRRFREEELVALYQSHDHVGLVTAIPDIIANSAWRVWARARSRGLQPGELEDIIAETQVRLLEGQVTLAGWDPARGSLRGHLDLRVSWVAQWVASAEDAEDFTSSSVEALESGFELEESVALRELALRALARVEESCSKTQLRVLRGILDGEELKETAEALGKDPMAVAPLLLQVRQRIRHEVEEEGL